MKLSFREDDGGRIASTSGPATLPPQSAILSSSTVMNSLILFISITRSLTQNTKD